MRHDLYLIKEALRWRRMLPQLGAASKNVLRKADVLTPETERRMIQGVRGVAPGEFVGSSAYQPPRVFTASPAEHLMAGRRAPMDPRNARLADPQINKQLQQFMAKHYPNLNVIKQLGHGMESSAFQVAPNAYTRRVTGQAGPVALKISMSDPRAMKLTAEQAASIAPHWDLKTSTVTPWWSYKPEKVYSFMEPVAKPLGSSSIDFFKPRVTPEGHRLYESSKPHLLERSLYGKGMETRDLGVATRVMPASGNPRLVQKRFFSTRGPEAAQAGWVRLPGEPAERLRVFDRGSATPAGQSPPHTDVMSTMFREAPANVLQLWKVPAQREKLVNYLLKEYPNDAGHWKQRLSSIGGLSTTEVKQLSKELDRRGQSMQTTQAVSGPGSSLREGLLTRLLGAFR